MACSDSSSQLRRCSAEVLFSAQEDWIGTAAIDSTPATSWPTQRPLPRLSGTDYQVVRQSVGPPLKLEPRFHLSPAVAFPPAIWIYPPHPSWVILATAAAPPTHGSPSSSRCLRGVDGQASIEQPLCAQHHHHGMSRVSWKWPRRSSIVPGPRCVCFCGPSPASCRRWPRMS